MGRPPERCGTPGLSGFGAAPRLLSAEGRHCPGVKIYGTSYIHASKRSVKRQMPQSTRDYHARAAACAQGQSCPGLNKYRCRCCSTAWLLAFAAHSHRRGAATRPCKREHAAEPGGNSANQAPSNRGKQNGHHGRSRYSHKEQTRGPRPFTSQTDRRRAIVTRREPGSGTGVGAGQQVIG